MFVCTKVCADEQVIEFEKLASHNVLLEVTKPSFRA
jgi:hypothetical protein